MKRALKWILAILVLAAIAAGAAVYFGLNRVYAPYKGFAGNETFVEVPSGSGPVVIGRRLGDAGVVSDHLTFRAALWISGRARELQAGEYRFHEPLSALQVINKIADGDVHRRGLTFREGLTIPEMAAVFGEGGFGRPPSSSRWRMTNR